MAISSTSNHLRWTSATALIVLVHLIVLGSASTYTGLSLDDSWEPAVVSDHGKFTHELAVNVMPVAAGPILSETPGFDAAARYRPPIINFKYQGGLVMTKPIHIYIVWYGSWAANEKAVIRTALSSLTPNVTINQFPNLSNLWMVMTKYYQQPVNQTRQYVSNNVTVEKEVDDGLTANKTINAGSDPFSIILKQINAGKLPVDLEQGIYFVMTASDIKYSDTSLGYCGYHSSTCVQIGSTPANCISTVNNLIYSFVPMPASNFTGCNIFNAALPGTPPNHAVSPSGALDTAINVIMHELLELVADPYPGPMPAWLDDTSENSEIADLCAYNFVADEWWYCGLPNIYPDFNSSSGQCAALSSAPSAGDPPRSLTDPKTGVIFTQYGVNGSQFMVQKIWSLANKGCVLQPEAPCSNTTVSSRNVYNGTIQRGLFFNGVGLQAYAPGQDCRWRIWFDRQVKITFTFTTLALGYDDLDYVNLTQTSSGALIKKVTGIGKNIVVSAAGNDFGVRFVTYGGRSPYPISAGFIMLYTATATAPLSKLQVARGRQQWFHFPSQINMNNLKSHAITFLKSLRDHFYKRNQMPLQQE